MGCWDSISFGGGPSFVYERFARIREREWEIMCSLFDELFAIRSLNDIMAGNRISGENPSISCSFCQSRAQMIQKWMTNSTKILASLFWLCESTVSSFIEVWIYSKVSFWFVETWVSNLGLKFWLLACSFSFICFSVLVARQEPAKLEQGRAHTVRRCAGNAVHA